MNHECAPQRMAGGYDSVLVYKWKSWPDAVDHSLETTNVIIYDIFLVFDILYLSDVCVKGNLLIFLQFKWIFWPDGFDSLLPGF